MSKVKTWIITVGGGYGSFEFVGTEEEAEEMRRHKAEWEGSVARKRLKSEIIPDESMTSRNKGREISGVS